LQPLLALGYTKGAFVTFWAASTQGLKPPDCIALSGNVCTIGHFVKQFYQRNALLALYLLRWLMVGLHPKGHMQHFAPFIFE
jgi:hypothetical protein